MNRTPNTEPNTEPTTMDTTSLSSPAPGRQGPRECLRTSKISVACDMCGSWPEIAHLPHDDYGFFCASCCPVCAPKGRKAGAA